MTQRPQGATGASASPVGDSCPSAYPIKGNVNTRNERIYHVPGGNFYAVTDPEQCFASTGAAEAAGFRRSLR